MAATRLTRTQPRGTGHARSRSAQIGRRRRSCAHLGTDFASSAHSSGRGVAEDGTHTRSRHRGPARDWGSSPPYSPPGPRRQGVVRWRSARTGPGSPPAASMAARGYSTRLPACRSPAWTTTRACTRWCSARTGPGWPPAATMAARGYSTRPPARRSPAWTTAAGSMRWRSARTGPGSPPAAPIGSARVFDAATGAQIARLDHGSRVHAVAFSPDGTRIATGSGDERRGCSTRPPARRSPALDHGGGERGGVQPGRDPDRHRQLIGSGAGIRRGYRRADRPRGPRQGRECGGVQPGRDPDRHRQLDRSARVFDADTGAQIARLNQTAGCMRWRSARTGPGSPPAPAATAARGCSTQPPARRSPAWTTTGRCTRWCSARTGPGSQPAAAMAARGYSRRLPAPRPPTWTTTAR